MVQSVSCVRSVRGSKDFSNEEGEGIGKDNRCHFATNSSSSPNLLLRA